MKHEAKNSKNINFNKPQSPDFVTLVDYNEDCELKNDKVAFHWWDSMYTSMHYHNHYEFFIVTKGKTYHTINNATCEIAKDTLYFIKPTDVHQFTPVNGTRCIHVNLAVTEEKLKAICEALSVDWQTLFLANPSALLSETEFSFFLQRAEQINYIASETNKEDASAAYICEMLMEAIAILYKRKLKESKQHPDWFEKLLRQIHSPERADISAEEIYSLSNYSPPILIKYFKQYTGVNIVAYLTRVKMNRACEFLDTADLTVTEIAGRLGYDSVSHFNKLFKEFCGITPSEYKKQRTR